MIDQELYNSLLNKLNATWIGLPDKPDETPQSTLHVIWNYVAGNHTNKNSYDNLSELNDEQKKQLVFLIDERIAGQPLSYLVSQQSFMGIDFISRPQAMIPRRETEILGYASLGLLKEITIERGSAQVIDLCTGSGNIALSLAYHEPNCIVWGADISIEAIELANRNADYLHLGNRVRFLIGDLFSPFEDKDFYKRIDLITCNPPYISTAQVDRMPHEISNFEPRLAFDGGPFGVRLMARLIKEAPRFLKPNSWLCFEVGLGQGVSMLRLLDKTVGFLEKRYFRDEKREIRVLMART